MDFMLQHLSTIKTLRYTHNALQLLWHLFNSSFFTYLLLLLSVFDYKVIKGERLCISLGEENIEIL